LVDVTFDSTVTPDALRKLGDLLPDIVGEAVACPEEPWTGPPEDGDIEIRFGPKGEFDVGTLNCVIEVRTKLFASRVRDKQRRVQLILDRLEGRVDVGKLGVWLILADGAWAQTTTSPTGRQA
jgi:hypothetical protein